MAKISVETDSVLRVSLPGYNVETATPEQCAIHSGFDYPKIEESMEGYELVTAPNTIGTGTTILKTIIHNFGYIPFFQVYLDDVDNNYNTDFAKLPFTQEVPVYWFYYAIPSITQLQIALYNSGDWGDIVAPNSPAGKRVGFKWAIWIND